MKARGWEGTDGDTSALVLTEGGRLTLWTNLCEWVEVHFDEPALGAAEAFAESHGMAPMSEERLAQLTGQPMTDEEATVWGDSQVRT